MAATAALALGATAMRGVLAGKLSLGRVAVVGLSLQAVGTIVLAVAHDPVPGAVGLAVLSMGDSRVWPSLNGMVPYQVPAERRRGSSPSDSASRTSASAQARSSRRRPCPCRGRTASTWSTSSTARRQLSSPSSSSSPFGTPLDGLLTLGRPATFVDPATERARKRQRQGSTPEYCCQSK